MFGYVQLDKDAPIKLKDYFIKNYCFLCRSLDRHYGLLARLFVSFDVTFFLILFSKKNYLADLERIRCLPATKKQKERFGDDFAKKVAALNLTLAAGDLADKINDGDHWYAKPLYTCYRPIFKKVKRDFPRMWQIVEEGHAEMSAIEERNGTVEEIECCFADFVEAIAREEFGVIDESKLSYLRFVAKMLYFMDAVDDLDKDLKRGSYNGLSAYGSKANYLLRHYGDLDKHLTALREEVKYTPPTDINTATVDRLLAIGMPERLAEITRTGYTI